MNDIILKQLDETNKKSGLVAEMVEGVILSRSVSSTKCANYLSGKAKKYSKIKRVERFYAHGYLDQGTAVSFVLNCFKSPYIASMDRTNWKRGDKDVNALVVYGASQYTRGMINLEMLDNHGGCSNFNDRAKVLEPLLSRADDKMIALTCDREFFSFEFVDHLIKCNAPFVIRIKKNLKFAQPLIKLLGPSGKIERNVLVGHFKGVPLRLDVSGKKLKDGDLILVSYRVNNPLKTYRKRWCIECFFKSLKTAGFNVESTRMTKLDRLKSMLLLCGMAYMMCVLLGILAHLKVEKIKFKRTLGCLQFSFFRYGLDWLTQFLFSARAAPNNHDPLRLMASHRLAISTVR